MGGNIFVTGITESDSFRTTVVSQVFDPNPANNTATLTTQIVSHEE
jgi:hypothetical protein